MIIKFEEWSPPESPFGPDAFKDQIGTKIPFSAGTFAGYSKLLAVTVAQDGSHAELTLELPDEAKLDVLMSKHGSLSNEVRPFNKED